MHLRLRGTPARPRDDNVVRGGQPGAAIAHTLNFTLTEVARGRAVFEGEPARFLYNPRGSVHGGCASTLRDSGIGCAVQTTLPAGKGYTTIDLSVSFVRAITERVRRVRCEATIVHAGRVVDESDNLYAHGTTTGLILTPR